MTRRAAILLLIALSPSALAEEPSPYAQLASLEQPPAIETPAAKLPAPIANGTVQANQALEIARHQAAEPFPPPPPNEGPTSTSAAGTPSTNVQPASQGASDESRLLRRSRGSAREANRQRDQQPQAADSPLALLASDATTTALAATALVVGLFLVCAWVFKRGMPKSSRPLPREAVEILGRCPLGNKQFAHLLHIGNKIILVNVTASGAETLVEVDDPNEVNRILGVCASSGPGSASKEFDAIFQQFAREPAPKGFLGDPPATYSSAAAAYSQSAEGGRHG